MVVLIVWVAVGGLSLLLLAILGFSLFSQFRRLQKVVERAQDDLAPTVDSLRSDTPRGRHRAG